MVTNDVPKFSLVRFKTLLRDAHGPLTPVHEVLHTQDELDEYLASRQGKSEPGHRVAFPEEKAVAVALGARPTGGYGVEIIAVVQETGGFVGVQHHVLYTEHVPHGLTNDMVTNPHHVIRLRGLSGIVSFRQVPDTIGHSLAALVGAATAPGTPPEPSTRAFGEEQHVTSFVVGEEHHLTSLYVGEEHHLTSLYVGEEHPPTAHVGEHPTTLALGEEGPGPGAGRGPFG